MTVETMKCLVYVEYALARLQGELEETAQEVKASGVEGSRAAAADLLAAGRLVRRAVLALDGPLTDAAMLAESLEAPPF